MEIERKYLVRKMPPLDGCACHMIEQAYLCTKPVVRIRREDDQYYLTYKGSGLMAREEYNLPLDAESYRHLLKKADGIILGKKRYVLPLGGGLKAELDEFSEPYRGLWLAEVEFSSIEEAERFTPPDWFGKEVTQDGRYHNSSLSRGIKLEE